MADLKALAPGVGEGRRRHEQHDPVVGETGAVHDADAAAPARQPRRVREIPGGEQDINPLWDKFFFFVVFRDKT